MHIYTDGSAIDGEVKATAIAPAICNQKQYVNRAYMGTESTFTVYAAELQDIDMTMSIVIAEAIINKIIQKVTIFTDNQASI